MTPPKTAFTRRRLAIIGATLLYSSGFYLLYILQGNREFLLYMAEFFVFIVVVCLFLQRNPSFPDHILFLVSFVGLLHVMGGGLSIGGERLYDLPLIDLYRNAEHPELFIFRYDQLIHAFGYGTAALGFRWLFANPTISSVPPLLGSALALLAVLGLGALNEISEFSATLLFDRTGVGGYFNVSLDLLFNFGGAFLAVAATELFAYLKEREGTPRHSRLSTLRFEV